MAGRTMLTSIAIKNFQAHEKLRVDFDPHVTTIVGPSDVGKSAILRALEWVCTNKPSGITFLRHDASRVSVLVSVDGRKLIRARGASVNQYSLDGKLFKALGSEVPEEVTDLLNVSSINFQAQIDAPFWFNDSPGQVSKNLNAIVDLGLIDDCMAKLGVAQRTAKARQEVVKDRLQVARTQAAQLRYIKEMECELRQLEELKEVASQKRLQTAQINDLVRGGVESRLLHSNAFGAHRDAVCVATLGKEAVAAGRRTQKLQTVIIQISQLTESAKLRSQLDFEPLTEQKNRIETLQKQTWGLDRFLSAARLYQDQQTTALQQCRTVQETLSKETGNRCPICQRLLTT